MNRKALEDDSPMDEESFAFGSFRLIPAQRMLLEDGKPLRLGSRALELLIALVEHSGETIQKDQLIARVWPDTVVDEGALRVHVAALRKALGDGRAGNRYIVNDPGRGYSFVAPVAREQRQPATAPPDGATVGGNLPMPLTRIVGRDGIIAALTTQLAQRRFLTVVGPGGIGKTTVAIAVAETLRASYGDGVWFVALASLADPDLVPSSLGAVLGISLPRVNPVFGLTAWLRDKHALIVLDSTLEIAFKEYLVNDSGTYYSDAQLLTLFSKRHLVQQEIQKYVTIDAAIWKKIGHFNGLRNKLVHERSTVGLDDAQIKDYRSVVETVLKKLFKLKLARG